MSQTVWEAYLKHELIVGYGYLAIGLIAIVLTTWAFKQISNNTVNKDEICASTVLNVLLFLIAIFLIFSGIAHIINPEYYAIDNILFSIRW